MKARTYRLELETLSPVMVTAGAETKLSPYTDFVQEGSFLFYLDRRKLERALSRQPALVDEFVRGVRTGMDNNRSNFELKRFIRERLSEEPAALALRRVPVTGWVGRAQVRRHVANGGRPYVPGSSIKGAIRTAILYCWLIDDPGGQRLVNEMEGVISGLWRRFQTQLDEAERLYREAQEAHERGDRDARGRLNREAGGRAFPVEREAVRALREFTDEPLFGSAKDKARGAEMRFLRVSDTAPVDALRVAEVARVKLSDGSRVSPQWSEVIPMGARSSFTVTIEPRFTRPGLTFLNEPPSPAPLLERLDRFAGHSITIDTNVLENLDNGGDFEDLIDAQAEIEELRLPPRGCILRLGGGKTYFDNSLGLALHRKDSTLFERFRRLLGLGRNPQTRLFSGKRFPATRSYVVEKRNDRHVPVEPLGWVKLTLV